MSEKHAVVSSSSASDAADGIGLRKVNIQYRDHDSNGPFFVMITLNGTANVLLPPSVGLIEKMYGMEFGSNFVAVGDIKILSSTEDVLAQINSGDTISRNGQSS